MNIITENPITRYNPDTREIDEVGTIRARKIDNGRFEVRVIRNRGNVKTVRTFSSELDAKSYFGNYGFFSHDVDAWFN